MVSLARRLVRIPSPFGEEGRLAEFVTDHLGDVDLQEVKGCGPNIVARKTVDDDGPTILLNAHMDTVEVWKGGLRPVTRGKRLFGLGAADMKAGLAIIMDLFRKSRFRHLNLIFAATVDEEGNSLGAHTLLRDKNLKGDLCLIPEPSSERLMLGARGRFALELEFRGKGGHGARPGMGSNAVEDAAKFIGHLKYLKPKTHPVLGKGSVCVLKIEGGGDSLSVPTSCVVRIDRHVVPGDTKSSVMRDLGDLANRLGLGGRTHIRWMKRPSPFLLPYISKSNPVVDLLVSEHRKYFGKGIGYGQSVGDYNLFGRRMPTVVLGPRGADWHTKGEYVEIDSVKRCYDFYKRFLTRLDVLERKEGLDKKDI